MATIPAQRFRSGEICIETGWYEFDGYVDGSSELLPALEEMEISLCAGQTFPLIRSRRRACFWKLARLVESAEDA